MSEDLDLVERFAPLATAAFASTTAPEVLRGRVVRRRRRRRTAVAGGSVVALVLVAVVAVAAGGAAPKAAQTVHAGPPVTTTVPVASLGTGPRLVIGTVPPEMASHGCGLQVLPDGGDAVTCSLGIPATPVPDGINLAWTRGPAPRALRMAWDRRDAEAVAAATVGAHRTAAFTEIGGRTVLDLSETDRVDGSVLGQSDRVTTTYEVLVGESMVQVNAEGATEAQLDAVVGNLGLDPTDLGFSIPEGLLPAGAEPIAEGQLRLWSEPDALAPERSDDNGGDASGLTYAVPVGSAPLTVSVIRDVDAASYIETWADQQERRAGATRDAIDADGRTGIRVRLRYGGVAGEGVPTGDLVAVAADDSTVVLVEASTRYAEAVVEVAGGTVVADAATADPGASDSSATDPPETEPAPGWYVPSALRDGWILDKGVAQGVDGSGEAQLWLTSPSGNQFVVTLKVASDQPWHSDGAVRHPLRGSVRPVYAEPARDDLPQQTLVTSRPGAIVLVDWVEVATDGTAEAAVQAGLDELDELTVSLVAADVGAWRSYLSDVPASPALLEAETLADLPDGT